MRFVYHRIQVQYETVFDSFGREIAFREFSRLGNLQRESIYNPDLNASTQISYHENGNIKEIGFTKNNEDYGHYQEYDKNGEPSKSWDYDEEGRQIKASIWIKK